MKKIKDLYDLYLEEGKYDEMPIFAPGERQYIRVWTEMQPIKEYYMIKQDERVAVYEVKKYQDEEVLILNAIYGSLVRALWIAERYDYCKNISVSEYDYYKEARYIQNILK